MKKSTFGIIGVIVLSFVLAVYLYPQMPDRLVSHWNFAGEPDGYMSKFWALFLMPIISVAVFLLFLLIPMIDPLRKNVQKFRSYFDNFVLLLILFLFYLYLLTIFWNLGFHFNMTRFFAPAIGVLFFYCGVLVQHARRNWFIGIRTPWTLSSDVVWSRTHRLGGVLFKIAGVLCFVGVLLPRFAVWFILVPVLLAALFTIVYSYVIFWRKL